MSSDSSSLSLDEVNTWNVDAFRLFCRKRHLKVSGNKAELVARLFAASEMGIPVQPSANELITRTETEKAKLLIAPDKTQTPDPLSLKDNWLRESDGLTSWPRYSIVNEIPSAENLPYLEMSGGSERLKENHAYF